MKSFYIAFLRCLVVLIIIAAPLAAQKKDKDLAKKLNEQADKAVTAKNFREAIDLYTKSLAIQPTNNNAHYRKGFAHFSVKEYDQAVQEFTLALNQGFKPPLEIYRVRYYIYFEQNNYDAALADIQKGLQLAPNDINFLSAVGEINYARKSYSEALAAFQKASVAAPTNADIFYNLARVYFAMGNTKGQAEAAASALAKGTRFPGETFYLLADANQKLNNTAGAIDAYQRAISSKPELYQAYRNLAELFHRENRANDAILILKQGQKQFANDGNLYTDISMFYSLADRPKDAVDAARAGVSILPNDARPYTNLCRAYNDTKDFNGAVSACNSALRLNPGDGETYFYLGRAYDQAGKTVEATRFYTQAVTGLVDYTNKNPDSYELWYLLGNAYFTDNQRDKAITAYQKCLALSPKFKKARYNLGIIYTRQKNKAAALEQQAALVPLDAKLADALKAEIDKM